MKYYVVYSPRGFANELDVKAFDTRAEATTFRSEVDNDINSYSYDPGTPAYRRVIRSYKVEKALYGDL